jgi:hypothetical protein
MALPSNEHKAAYVDISGTDTCTSCDSSCAIKVDYCGLVDCVAYLQMYD